MGQHSKIWVIGAGLVGLCIAKALAERGLSVGVIGADWGSGRASYGNAGHIGTEQVDTLADPKMLKALPGRLFSLGGPAAFPIRDIASWLPFGMRFLRCATPQQFKTNSQHLKSLIKEVMPAWSRLAASLGEPLCAQMHGHRLVFESARSARLGVARWLKADCGEVTTQPLDAQTLAELEHSVQIKLYGGIQFTGSGQVSSPPEVLQRMEAALRQLNVDCLTEHIINIETLADNHYRLIAASGQRFDATGVVIAAGAASHKLLKTLGFSVPLIAERGYHLEGHRGPQWTQPGPVVFEDRHVVVTGFHDRLRATSFVEFSNVNSPPDLRKWWRLNQHLNELGVPMGAPRDPWIGARPTLPDYLPAIGPLPSYKGIWTAFGHQHLGLTLAPITGELIAAQIAGDLHHPSINLTAFSVSRFL